MRIQFSNVSNPVEVSYPIFIIKGSIENYSQDVWKKHKSRSFMLVYHQAGNDYKRCEEIEVERLQFKFLVRLHKGDNSFAFDFLGVKDTLIITYSPIETPYKVRLVYIVCRDDDGTFQGPDGMNCNLVSAKTRISLGGELLQCIMAETLWEAGLGRRTFALEVDQYGCVDVHTLHCKLSLDECWRMSGEELWESIAREIMLSSLKDDKCKYLAFLSCTRYNNPRGIIPSSYSQVLRMTKGHVALGGGGLALFGTGALWTWPTHLHQVEERLLSTEKIDPLKLMDDSAYRGTVGGSFATTIGSVLHELGHCFDLGHTADGIMARGFDDIDLFFTLAEGNSGKSAVRRHLNPCSNYQLSPGDDLAAQPISRSNSCSAGDMSPRFTCIRRSDSISKYLEGYAQKRLRYQNKNVSGVFWSSSCALILSKQKWISTKKCLNEKLEIPLLELELCCDLGAVEVRGERGKVLHHWTEETLPLEARVLAFGNREANLILAITHCGNVVKKAINQK